MNKRTLNVVTAATFALLSIFELVRALLGHAWPGYSALGNLVDVVHIPCWTAAAVGLFLRRSWGYAFAALSTILVFTHGVGINAGGSKSASWCWCRTCCLGRSPARAATGTCRAGLGPDCC
ncbi:MAG: hypothetical protein HY075_00800 [Deltaproteobacteria bacterium]|nr:hypothetical protein [Deltaproteobacteria bacterium]